MGKLERIESMVNEIADKRNELSKLTYNDKNYDDIEDELHELEDKFNDEFEKYFEEILEDIHADISSDADILLPSAYFAQAYIQEKGQFKFGDDDGVLVDSEDYEGKEVRIVLLPNPVKFALVVNRKIEKDLWTLR